MLPKVPIFEVVAIASHLSLFYRKTLVQLT